MLLGVSCPEVKALPRRRRKSLLKFYLSNSDVRRHGGRRKNWKKLRPKNYGWKPFSRPSVLLKLRWNDNEALAPCQICAITKGKNMVFQVSSFFHGAMLVDGGNLTENRSLKHSQSTYQDGFFGQRTSVCSEKIYSPLKHDGWKTTFLLKCLLSRGHINFRNRNTKNYLQ